MKNPKIYFWEKPLINNLLSIANCPNSLDQERLRIIVFWEYPIFFIGWISLIIRGMLKRG